MDWPCVFHRYEAIDCEAVTIVDAYRSDAVELVKQNIGSIVTRILERCRRCGRIRSRQISGGWTIQQLRKDQPQ